jgi:DNA polymerase iota|eukprot:CAMPEP_0119045382 /NCGR_PEP_ID=MMETSP1177-20130426/39305_1 /TAXON_ID=2985 /ORGANISM="Ochromonas sp, Strain CCMP1899" /LENGTH=132 /DNA_ID=CAMNT_0007017039 /DNA_START=32 /DNA_END=427 /DNA_ORIENTATION=+
MEDDNEDSDGEVSDESYGREIITKGKDSHARTIIHLDVDCFYATVEIILNPELRGKPIGIQQKHLLVTCSYEARAMGVEKCMSMVKALEICPNIIIINGENLYKYREMSEAIYSILQDYTPLVEKLGLDENW